MKKVIRLSVVVLLVLATVIVWQKDKILAVLRPASVVNPVSRQPGVYELVTMLEGNGFKVSTPPSVANGTIQASISGVSVLFSDSKDFFTQVRSLQLVLPKSKMEGRTVKEIDLRFEKVILRY